MLLLPSLLSLIGLLSAHASATALTYKLVPNEKECFYSHVDQQGAKVAFYFAVQSGGSFDSTHTPPRPQDPASSERDSTDRIAQSIM